MLCFRPSAAWTVLTAVFITAASTSFAKPPAPANPVQLENAKTDGVSNQWVITGAEHAYFDDIGGYASATSVNRGGSIDFYVSVKNPLVDTSYTIDVYRMGWYGGAGGRRILPTITRSSRKQADCGVVVDNPPTAPDPLPTNMVECDWIDPYTLNIPTSADPTVAMSGVYLAKLKTNATGLASYIIFVVRDDARRGDFLFQSSATTFAAYNDYGGYSFYSRPTTAPVDSNSRMVSFNRPYNPRVDYASGNFLAWEIRALRFLEREGYNALYSSSIDTHTNGERLKQFRAFLSVGHDEYWTRSMLDAVRGARDVGVNLAFIGANAAYWQIRLEPDAQGRPNRRIVGFRDWAYAEDPLYATPHATVRWRDNPLFQPESALIGVQYNYDPVDADMIITDCIPWLCRATGVKNGTRLPGLLGYEVDQVTTSSPAGIQVIARSPYVVTGRNGAPNETRYANMTYYTAPSGAGVFATGSMQWTWGLDGFQPYVGSPVRVNAGAQAMTRNVLDRFLTLPAR